MYKSFRYRIYPNKSQKETIRKNFDSFRFTYNFYLGSKESVYSSNLKRNKDFNLIKPSELKELLPWLKEIDSTVIQSALELLKQDYSLYYRGLIKKLKFKKKKDKKQSYCCKNIIQTIEYQGKYIKLPKLGKVKTKNKLVPYGKILKAIVTEENNKYYVSLQCELNLEQEKYLEARFDNTNKKIGIDLGIKDFLVTNLGEKIENSKFYRNQIEYLYKQKKLLYRKTKYSKNYNRQKDKIYKIIIHTKNQRRDFLQKLSTELIRKYDVICVEDLSIKSMQSNNSYLSGLIKDCGWNIFVRMLEYKSIWYGKKLIKVGKFFPSSQKCHVCGYKNVRVKNLSIREWKCPQCNTYHDRDINAAINILNEGLRILNQNVVEVPTY